MIVTRQAAFWFRSNWATGSVSLLLAALFAGAASVAAPVKNGFDLANSSVPADQILQGGPPRDGIPAINDPFFEPAVAVTWLNDADQVIGVALAGEARAYPIRILNWHEIVNDEFGDQAVLVTFCPLCGTGIVFSPDGTGRPDFGVSGLLYNSDVLLYDRKTESLWSQILAEAVAGPQVGMQLTVLPSLQTTWGKWRTAHPGTAVLSRMTGHVRNYDADPYEGYARSPATFFPVANEPDETFHPKERVLGIRIGEHTKAYPYSVLAQQDQSTFKDIVGDQEVIIEWDVEAPVAWATDLQGNQLPTVDGFWFAWYAFFPETEVWVLP